MKYQAKSTALSMPTDCIIVGIYKNNEFTDSFKQLNEQSENYLSQLVQSGDLSAEIGQSRLLHHVKNIAATRLLIVGCGEKDKLNERRYKQIFQHIANVVISLNINEITNNLTDLTLKNRDLYWNIRLAIETLEQAFYQFDQFKSQKAEKCKINIFTFNTADERANKAILHANAIAAGIAETRNVANMPPNICNPAYLAAQAKKLAEKSTALSCSIVDEEEMKALGMNAYLAVSSGSANAAYMSVLDYRNAPNKNANPIVLVGKGLTFDAGGISLKPAADMDEMKYDMGGAAAVLGVMKAVVELSLPLNVIGVLAGCENLPDGGAYRPGDILTTMNGLTVEVLNTDAEGRLVLCDALTYAERFEPELVIDVATLTGACVVALGPHNSGLVSEDEELAAALLQAATQTTDNAWRLPLSEEYREQLKSSFADLANIGGRWGGASTAAAFLSNFTKKYRWAHLDIAGTAWRQGAEKGATGRPVALLTQFLLNRAKI